MQSRKVQSGKITFPVNITKTNSTQHIPELTERPEVIRRILQNAYPNLPAPHVIQRMQQLYGNARTQRILQANRDNTLQRMNGSASLEEKTKLTKTEENSSQKTGLQYLLDNQTELKSTILFYKPKLTLQEATTVMTQLAVGDVNALKNFKIVANKMIISGNILEDDEDEIVSYKKGGEKEEEKSRDQAELDTQRKTVEWGLLQDPKTGEVAIFKGTIQATYWDVFLNAGLIPLAHTHPHFKRTFKDKGYEDSPKFSVVEKDFELRGLVFPSGGDIAFAGENVVQHHTVFTPYYYSRNNAIKLEDGILSDEGKPENELWFEIIGSKKVEEKKVEEKEENDGTADMYEATLVAHSGKSIIKKYKVTARSNSGSGPLASIQETSLE